MTKYRIFSVEDDDDDRGFLLEAFELNGCTKELLFFYSYGELLRTLESLPVDRFPQLIILDNQIQGLSAVSTIDLLLLIPHITKVKLAIYTSSLPDNTCSEYKAQGVHLCLQKGNTIEEIQEDVSKFCLLAASYIEDETTL